MVGMYHLCVPGPLHRTWETTCRDEADSPGSMELQRLFINYKSRYCVVFDLYATLVAILHRPDGTLDRDIICVAYQTLMDYKDPNITEEEILSMPAHDISL